MSPRDIKNLPRSERALRRAIRAYATGGSIEDVIEAAATAEAPQGEAITLEGDTVTVEALRLEDVTV